jgi:hypothetical protein
MKEWKPGVSFRDGREIRRERLSSDRYAPPHRLVWLGVR